MVLVEAISVIVRLDAIIERYPGGIVAFTADAPNQTFCHDGEVGRVGFMAPDDLREYVSELASNGLVHLRDGNAVDVVVVDQQRGPTSPCDWLEVGTVTVDGNEFGGCCLKGSKQDQVITPEGWRFEGSLSDRFKFEPTTKAGSMMRRVGHEDGLDAYEDLKDGKLGFVGRTAKSGGLAKPNTEITSLARVLGSMSKEDKAE